MKDVISYKKSLIDLLGNCENEIILDYGCGKGDFVELFLGADKKPKTILAVDSDENMITHIKKRFSSSIDKGILLTKVVDHPADLHETFDKIICHNVLECVDKKLDFINSFADVMAENAVFILSHHDFDSAIYNSAFTELSRNLIHYFSDTKQDWMKFADGQMGRKIPGLINHSVFNRHAKIATWRMVDTTFEQGTYGYLMADMINDVGREKFTNDELKSWRDDLVQKSYLGEYYFAIDLNVAICRVV